MVSHWPANGVQFRQPAAKLDWGLDLTEKKNQPGRANAPADRHRLCRRYVEGDANVTAHVVALARRVVSDRGYYIPYGEREDIVQQIALDTYRALTQPAFVLEREFDAFVRSISARRCVDWMRRLHPTQALTPHLVDGAPNPHEQLSRQEMLELGRGIMRRLQERCRDLIRLRVQDGLSYREIATRWNSTEGALRNQMYKCLQHARRILAQQESSP